jgi:acyl carrier protein
MRSIEEEIRKFIAENILFSSDGYPYLDEVSFLETGVVDSMAVMELVMFSEEYFDLTIDDHEVVPDNFDSVTKLADFIRRKLAVLKIS